MFNHTFVVGRLFHLCIFLPARLSSQSQRQLLLTMEAHGRYIARLMEQEGIAPRGDPAPDGNAPSTAAMAAAAATPAGGRAERSFPIPVLELAGGPTGGSNTGTETWQLATE